MTAVTQEISDKKARYLAKRKKLIELSEMVRENVGEDGEFETVNEALKALYGEEGHEELNTYNQWREMGYQVRKGSEALLVWGKPRRSEQGPEDEDRKYKFWPLCYLFSNLQVDQTE